jgi:hypothetical protein
VILGCRFPKHRHYTVSAAISVPPSSAPSPHVQLQNRIHGLSRFCSRVTSTILARLQSLGAEQPLFPPFINHSEEKLPQSSARRSGIFERSSRLAGLSLHRALYEPSRPPRRLPSPGRQEVGRSDAFEASLAPAGSISLPRRNSPQPAELNKALFLNLAASHAPGESLFRRRGSFSLPWLSQTSAGE